MSSQSFNRYTYDRLLDSLTVGARLNIEVTAFFCVGGGGGGG